MVVIGDLDGFLASVLGSLKNTMTDQGRLITRIAVIITTAVLGAITGLGAITELRGYYRVGGCYLGFQAGTHSFSQFTTFENMLLKYSIYWYPIFA